MARVRKSKSSYRKLTGLSRGVLLTLKKGPLSVAGVLEAMGPRSESVHEGTIWTILSRARQNGLVRRELAGRTYLYELTAGGDRRVRWIEINRAQDEVTAVANPPDDGEGD